MISSDRSTGWQFVRAWNTNDEALVEQVKSMWRRELAFSEDQIVQRSSEIIVVVLRDGEVVGVSTAVVKPFKLLNNHEFFFYRFFVRADCRAAGLDAKLTVESVRYLEEIARQRSPQPIGVIAILENKEIAETPAARRAVWRAVPFTFIGMVSPGYPVRVYYFRDAMI